MGKTNILSDDVLMLRIYLGKLVFQGEADGGGWKFATDTVDIGGAGEWDYMVGTYSAGSNLRVIANDERITSGDVIGNIQDGTHRDFFIGCYYGNQIWWDGKLD